MKKKTLTLNVSKQWFDMIVTGEKTEEYRIIKPYWVARLFQNNSNVADVKDLASCLAGRTDLLKEYINTQRIILKPYTHVLFVKGYPKGNKPSVEKEIVSITIGKPKKGLCPDKWLGTEFFVIKFEYRMKKEERCCGNCHWFDNEDIYGVGWCSINSCDVSCDFVCIRHIN